MSSAAALKKIVPTIAVDANSCINCNACFEVCPSLIFRPSKDEKIKMETRNPERCIECGHCVGVCPTDAVKMSIFPPEVMKQQINVKEFERKLKKEELTLNKANLMTLMKSRRSVREFDQKVKLSKEDISEIYELVKHAGTGSNKQSTNVAIIQNPEALKEIEKYAGEGMLNFVKKFFGGKTIISRVMKIGMKKSTFQEFNGLVSALEEQVERNPKKNSGFILRGAPAVIVTFVDKQTGIYKNIGGTDSAIAIRNIEMWALTKGLGSCWCGFLQGAASFPSSKTKLMQLMGLDPKKHSVTGVLLIGKSRIQYQKSIPRKERVLIVKE